MKPSAFAYARPRALEEAFALLDKHGENAKLLAGGQSLLATLNMRLAAPEILVDIGAIPGLDGIAVQGKNLVIGARATHRAIERSEAVAKHAPLLAQAAPHIAHVAIRNAGTLGGSLAMADPAAEWPACCIALEANIVIASKKGERRVPAGEFFKDLYTTALGAGELITAVEIPCAAKDERHAFLELVRRRGDYAIVGLAARARVKGKALAGVQLVFLGVGVTPVQAKGAMAALEGKAADDATLRAAQTALDAELAPSADIYTSAEAKRHLARVLVARAVAALAG
ncbi:MAG TPA: xanthine dehydrogenase family protein subunit M [Burkholderiales bacterium]|nr:xanthine dehydrogenase family protein subunit M [Burkholderiales bacterium]